MAHIVYNADGSFRAAYKNLGPDDLELVTADAAKRGALVSEVPASKQVEVLQSDNARRQNERAIEARTVANAEAIERETTRKANKNKEEFE
jgi:hypothetical protein